jgi:hypothetical protein
LANFNVPSMAGTAMKILIVASYSRSLINFRLQLIEALLASGYKVHVAVPGMHTDKPTV